MEDSIKQAYTKNDAENLLADINNQIQHADQKASILLAFIGIVVGLTLNAFIALKQLNFTNNMTLSVVIIIVFVIYLSTLIASLVFEILVLTARHKISKFKKYGIDENVLYFGYIANVGYKEFNNKIDALSEEDIVQGINIQIFVNSYIANKKYRFFNLALFSSVAVLISAIVVTILTSLL